MLCSCLRRICGVCGERRALSSGLIQKDLTSSKTSSAEKVGRHEDIRSRKRLCARSEQAELHEAAARAYEAGLSKV